MSRLLTRLTVLGIAISLSILGFSENTRAAASAGFFAPPNATEWVGAVLHPDGTTDPIRIQSSETGTMLSIQPKTDIQAIKSLNWQGTTLEFNTVEEPTLRFVGQYDGTQVNGQMEQDGQSSKFVLFPLLPLTDADLSDYVGVYRFPADEALSIILAPSFAASGFDFFWHGLALNHFGTGAVRGLYPIAPDVFLVGSARVVGYPFLAQITFDRDGQGKVSGLRWQARDAATGKLSDASRATFILLKHETVRYASADKTMLTGLLTLPQISGPRPAMVVLHGSERGTRDDFGRQQMSSYLASQGFAVLTFDKRGVGDSEGTYREIASDANLALLAQDARAGVNYLKGRSEVDTQHIGLIGTSQAGWIIPLTAQTSDVRFFVILSGPVVSVGIENQYSRYTNNGNSTSPYTTEDLSKMLAKVAPSGFDPLPILAKVQQPGLWLWGDQDKSIPIPESVSNLKALIMQGKANFMYQVFANADHNLQQSVHGLFNEIPYSVGFPDQYYATLGQWLQTQIKV